MTRRPAFATEEVRLALWARQPWVTELGNWRDVLEVDVFGRPAAPRRVGFHDLPHAADATVAAHLVHGRRGNVRAILNCDLVRDDDEWLTLMDRALARLR